MKYKEFKRQQEQKNNNFEHIFFAFSDNQFKEGIEKLGIPIDNYKDKIISIGCGGYVLKDKLKDFHALIDTRDNDLKLYLQDPANLKDALIYELANHEYCITYDITDTLSVLDLDQSDIDPELLKDAINQYLANCGDW